MSQHPDVVVVGGGAIGCAIAWRLAQAGAAVTIIERGQAGHGATWAAAGMLSPFGEITHPSFLELTSASRDLYDSFIGELTEASGVAVEFGAPGKLEFAFTEEDLARLRTKHPPVLQRSSAHALEPAVSSNTVGAVLYPRDAFVDNRALGEALAVAAGRAGATLRLGVTASSIESVKHTVRAVILETGERIACSFAVLCAGAWSAHLKGLTRPLPVRPVKGQMVALRSDVQLRHMLQYEHCYIIPRSEGRVLVGATVEHVGFDGRTTALGIESMLSAARELVPGLADAELLEIWTGFRPGTHDDLPILGAEPMLTGLVYATGHYRNGILLTPVTAQLITELITGSAPALPLEAFSVQRFRDE